MAEFIEDLPSGFVLDELPEGFVIDEVETKKTNPVADFGKGVVQGLGSLPSAIGTKVGNKLRPLVGKKELTQEEIQQKIKQNPIADFFGGKPETGAGKAGYTIGNLAPAFFLPEVKAIQGAGMLPKVANMGLTGAYQGGLVSGSDAIINNGDLGDVAMGTALGGGIGAGLPVAGKVATESIKLLPKTGNVFAKGLARLKQNTIDTAVKPNSQALDLTEDTAQNLLMDTTERVQNNYNEILDNAGKKVGEEIQKLPEDFAFDNMDLMQSVDNIYNNYSLSGNPKLNVAYNQAGKEYNKIQDFLLNKADVTPQELFDINKNISKMVQWDNPNAKLSNEILEQIYGDFSNRIASLSPELRQANATYSKLADFKKNEGIRKILRPNDNIDSASTALKNYNNTVTKGNTNRNIQDLENILVNNGYEPFLNNIDDVNAAMDLLNARTTGDSFIANLGTQATRPLLKIARELNKRNIPQTVQQAGQNIGKFNQRVLPPIMAKTPLLYGNVEYNEGY